MKQVRRNSPMGKPRKIPIMRPSLPPLDLYIQRLERIWKSRMLSNFGENARELEQKAQKYLGNKHVRAAASCDVALILGISALSLPKGGKCIVTPFTFNSTVNAIIWNGLKPDFVDIDEQTFNLDPTCVRKAIKKETIAIVATHVFGNPCKIKELKEIANEHSLPLIFDAAHAYGSVYHGKKVGTFGDIEAFSMSGTKLVTAGEGGLITTTKPEIISKFEMLRNYGFYGDYNSHYVGMNGKISELNAALGCLTIDSIESSVRRRNEIASQYVKLLGESDFLHFQYVDSECRSAYKDFGVRISRGRKKVEGQLKSKSIQTKRYFLPAHWMDAFSRFKTRPLPQTDRLYGEILCLPIYNEMSDSEVERVCRVVTGKDGCNRDWR
jgi:dTDP-4-amino-4,6-dideoxygalactose transaminase